MWILGFLKKWNKLSIKEWYEMWMFLSVINKLSSSRTSDLSNDDVSCVLKPHILLCLCLKTHFEVVCFLLSSDRRADGGMEGWREHNEPAAVDRAAAVLFSEHSEMLTQGVAASRECYWSFSWKVTVCLLDFKSFCVTNVTEEWRHVNWKCRRCINIIW